MSLPRVSIIVITYNQQDFIEETLLSALEQNYQNLEVVVADDASSDATPRIIGSLAEKYPGRLVPVLNPINVGITANTNHALKACTGEFVALQGGDDLLVPGKISRQVEFMREHPDVALSYHDAEVFESESGHRLYLWSERFGKLVGDARTVVRWGPYMPGTAVMVRSDCIPAEGMDERIRIASDWLFYVRVLAAHGGKIGYIDQVLARYRRSMSNVTRDWKWKFEDQSLTLALIESRWPEYVSLVCQRRSELYFTQAVRHFSTGNRGTALRLVWKSITVAFPSLPWLRLIWRELLFYRKHSQQDDLMKALLRHG